jgi:hypothetical protein
MASDEEQVAIDQLARHLDAAGEPITVLRRPDQEVRDQRAVDFEVDSNGVTVGVEVTSASAYTADLRVIDQFESAVEDGLRPLVEANALGTFAVQFSYHERPRKRDVPKLVESVVRDVSAALRAGSDWFILPNPPAPIERVEVTRISRSRNVVGRISSPIPAWWVEGEVDEFVKKLIQSKATQGVVLNALDLDLRAHADLAGC